MSSACDSCPSKGGCTSQDTCPTANGVASSAPAKEPLSSGSHITRVIGIASGKGGVGKSFVTSVLAVSLARQGLKVGIMDADVTGPSIPQSFGFEDNLRGTEDGYILPAESKTGIKAVSVNLMLDNKEAPVIWRGPVLNSLVRQFWGQTDWGMLDVLLIDMPPGTGDVPLTVFQAIPIDGIVLVATSQDLVSMIVNKARNMASMMNVPVLGLVENMSYIKCPDCGTGIRHYGDGTNLEKSAAEIGSKVLDRLPLDPEVTKLVDSGRAEDVADGLLTGTAKMCLDLVKS